MNPKLDYILSNCQYNYKKYLIYYLYIISIIYFLISYCSFVLHMVYAPIQYYLINNLENSKTVDEDK